MLVDMHVHWLAAGFHLLLRIGSGLELLFERGRLQFVVLNLIFREHAGSLEVRCHCGCSVGCMLFYNYLVSSI